MGMIHTQLKYTKKVWESIRSGAGGRWGRQGGSGRAVDLVAYTALMTFLALLAAGMGV